MSTNVVGYPFEEYNKTSATDYVVDPRHWGHIARISKRENMWRVNFGVKHDLSDEEMEETIHEACKKLFPRPKSMGPLQKNEYKVTLTSPTVFINADVEASGSAGYCWPAMRLIYIIRNLNV